MSQRKDVLIMKMYSSEICPGCKMFKALIAERGIEESFEIIDITEDVLI